MAILNHLKRQIRKTDSANDFRKLSTTPPQHLKESWGFLSFS